jgi:hypothetical protein
VRSVRAAPEPLTVSNFSAWLHPATPRARREVSAFQREPGLDLRRCLEGAARGALLPFLTLLVRFRLGSLLLRLAEFFLGKS